MRSVRKGREQTEGASAPAAPLPPAAADLGASQAGHVGQPEAGNGLGRHIDRDPTSMKRARKTRQPKNPRAGERYGTAPRGAGNNTGTTISRRDGSKTCRPSARIVSNLVLSAHQQAPAGTADGRGRRTHRARAIIVLLNLHRRDATVWSGR